MIQHTVNVSHTAYHLKKILKGTHYARLKAVGLSYFVSPGSLTHDYIDYSFRYISFIEIKLIAQKHTLLYRLLLIPTRIWATYLERTLSTHLQCTNLSISSCSFTLIYGVYRLLFWTTGVLLSRWHVNAYLRWWTKQTGLINLPWCFKRLQSMALIVKKYFIHK